LPLSDSGPAPVLQTATPEPRKLSHLEPGQIIRQVSPAYPPLARAMGVQGEVVLRAIISRTGELEQLEVISGHPLLVRAATDAVGQWKFRPYILNGVPVEVETRISVNFILNRD